MQVVILAGGLGTRIRSVAPDTPKVLIPVAGRPFIEWQFELLEASGLKDVLMCIGNMGEHVMEHVGDGAAWNMRVSYAQEDPSALMGTGGALVKALDKLGERFLVMYGDSYLPIDYRLVVNAFDANDYPAMMCVYRNEGKWDQSNVRIEGDRVAYYSKEADPGEVSYIDYGLNAFDRQVIERYRDRDMPLDLAVILQDAVGEEQLGAFEVRERFYEIGKPEGLRELEDYLRSEGRQK